MTTAQFEMFPAPAASKAPRRKAAPRQVLEVESDPCDDSEPLFQIFSREYVVRPPFDPELTPRLIELEEPMPIARATRRIAAWRRIDAQTGWSADYWMEPA